MKPPRDVLKPSPIERLRTVMRGNWIPAAVILALLASFVLAGRWSLRQMELPSEREQAEIVRFGLITGNHGESLVVLVRTADGGIHEIRIGQTELARCRPGDGIVLVRQGGELYVDRTTCTRVR